MSYGMPRVIVLKEGTDQSQGKAQLISNINACEAVTSILKTTLGPRGRDKLIHDGNRVTITNDGATIIKLLDVVHPAAKTLVDIARSQDEEVGDGTTSVCLITGELLASMKPLIEEGMHPNVIIRGCRLAHKLVQEKLRHFAVDVDKKDDVKLRELLVRCAGTALNSKLIAGQKGFFAKMCVDAVMHLDEDLDDAMIGIKKVPGGSVTDSFLVEGVAFKKTFAYAGFEQQPKEFKSPGIVLLNVELELKSERHNAEVRIKDPREYQSIVDAEWTIIYDKLKSIVASGAKIVLSKLPIGDLATQYFADRDIFCAGRVPEADLVRVGRATGGVIQTSLADLNEKILGRCDAFEERQIGPDRYNLFTGCPKSKSSTIILRGGAEQFIAEAERSLHDAIMIVKRALAHSSVVGGGGAIELELSRFLHEYSKTIKSKLQLVVAAYAKALEIIPRQLAENAGFDSTDLLNLLRAAHANGDRWAGINIEEEGICDTFKAHVWEPVLVKQQALGAATEAACMVLSVDETVRNPRSESLRDDRPAGPPRPSGGRGMRQR